jgi:hypothetical protein
MALWVAKRECNSHASTKFKARRKYEYFRCSYFEDARQGSVWAARRKEACAVSAAVNEKLVHACMGWGLEMFLEAESEQAESICAALVAWGTTHEANGPS